jgi:predicted aminopeptidase
LGPHREAHLWENRRVTQSPAARTLIGSLFGLLLSGCSLGYYGHTLWGGARILLDRRPIPRLLADPAISPDLRARLARVERIVDFAHRELALPETGGYRAYVALDRPYAVWNVVAAPELSIEPLTWCFPIAGCVAYRGYFSERKAERFAATLRGRGHDVEIGGVAAYSTLGHFADPVLSSFVFWPESDLAGLIFHELAHSRVYVGDSTAFNESFATTVELAGVDRWLGAEGLAEKAEAARDRYRREQEVVALLLDYRARLASAYAAERTDDWKRERKAELLRDLEAAYGDLRASGGGTRGYDAWLAEGVDNARLAAVGSYHRWVPAFEALLVSKGGDLEAFYAEVERLSALPTEAREAQLGRYSGE